MADRKTYMYMYLRTTSQVRLNSLSINSQRMDDEYIDMVIEKLLLTIHTAINHFRIA